MLAGHLALIVAALFAGAAVYVNIAEQPARLQLDDRALLAEWKPAYKRGYAMQAPLAALGFLLGVLAWWQTSNGLWLAGGAFLVRSWPYPFLVRLPVNNKLMAVDPAKSGPASRTLVQKWGGLHAV